MNQQDRRSVWGRAATERRFESGYWRAPRGSERHIILDAAPMSNIENPETFNQQLLEFLTKTIA
jgi:hypothetical protein